MLISARLFSSRMLTPDRESLALVLSRSQSSAERFSGFSAVFRLLEAALSFSFGAVVPAERSVQIYETDR